MSETEQPELARLTVELLRAYVTNNVVPSSELAGLIETTRAALAGDVAVPSEPASQHVPAVSVEESLASPDHIRSLIDGKPYKTLKRHLANNGLTPEEYKARYKLPVDYPLVAPTYSETRRKVAQNMGLGGRPAPVTSRSDNPAPAKPTPDANASDVKAAPSKPAARDGGEAVAVTKAKPTKRAASRSKKADPAKAPAKAGSATKPTAAAGKGASSVQAAPVPPATLPAETETMEAPTKAAGKPARRMARGNSVPAATAQGEGSIATGAASTPTPSPAPTKPLARKKLALSLVALATDTVSPKPAKQASKSKAASKAGSGRRGKGANAANAASKDGATPKV